MKRQPIRLLIRWGLITTALSALLFLAAGTSRIGSLRAYLAIFSAWLLVTMLAVDPRLARERVHPGNADIDDGLRFATGFFFLITLTVAALSVGRLGPFFNAAISLRHGALVVYGLSGSLQTWAMIVNPFFSPVVRLQTECGHRVIENGPYRFMRHPGYFAMLIALPASAIAIGSWLAVIPAVCFVIIVLRRLRTENNFLRKYLPGYADYATRVPSTLVLRPKQRAVEQCDSRSEI